MAQNTVRDLDIIIESHEDRLQKVEGDGKEVIAAIATLTTKQESLAERVNYGIATIMDKMESCIAPLTEKMEQHIADSKVNDEKYAILAKTVEKIDQVHQKDIQRYAMIKKGFWAVTLTALGAGGKLLFEMLFAGLK